MDLKRLFSARRARLGTLSGAGVLALAAGLALVNLISQRAFLRLDWTGGGRYSLSQVSRRLVRGLPDPVLFRAYISGGLPQPYLAQARYVQDLLAEYRVAGRGRVKVEVIDPESSEKAKADARSAGVAPARFTQVAADQFQVREGFLGVAVFYQDKQEVLPFVKDPDALEDELTSRLRKMSRTSKKTLGVVAGHGETSLDKLREGAGVKLFDDFTVKSLVLGSPAREPVDLVYIVNPLGEYSAADLDALDVMISSGVPAAFFLSRRAVNLQTFAAVPRRTGLEDLLAHYGIRQEEDIVLDPQCQQVTLNSHQGGFTVSNIVAYPAFILSRPKGRNPVTRGLEALSFPFAHPLVPAASTGVAVTPLLASSPISWVSKGRSSVDPYTLRPAAPDDRRGPFTLAALAEGTTPSFRDPARTARPKLAVVGTGYFLDGKLPLSPGNADAAVLLAEWLIGSGEDAPAIPSRAPAFRPLRAVPDALRASVKLAGHLFLPIAIALFGVGRWLRRRARRPAVQKEWEAAARA